MYSSELKRPLWLLKKHFDFQDVILHFDICFLIFLQNPLSWYYSADFALPYFPISKIPFYRGIGIRVPRLSATQPGLSIPK
jgi:hypothetical protein